MQVWIEKLDVSVDVKEWDDLPQVTRDFLIDYAWKQKLGDAVASFKADELDKKDKNGNVNRESAEARVADVIANLEKGVIRSGGGGKTADPVTRRAREIAEGKVKASPAWKAWLQENELKAADKDARDALVAKVRELAPQFMDKARAQIESESDIDVPIAF